ncbi:MAG: YceI family protein [Proteobacteria bacterium]|nr:YceI family protein [Pseudomonadota bacterium]
MPIYRVDSQRSGIVVRARSSIHDTNTTWDTLSGRVEADPATLDSAGATASLVVDMTSYDAGDWLKNRKLKKDLDLARHPIATFDVTALRDVRQKDRGQFSATADGVLRWRDRELSLTVTGQGIIDNTRIEATGSFDMDIRELGVQPPRFLMFKVANEVTVEVTLHARAE